MGGSISREGKNKGWREAERGKNEGNKDGAHNSDEATFFFWLFGCNAGVTEPLNARIIIYFHRIAAVKRNCLNLILSLATSQEFSRMREAEQKKNENDPSFGCSFEFFQLRTRKAELGIL